MKKIIRLTESDLMRLVKRVISEKHESYRETQGRLKEFAESLYKQHSDVVEIVWKFNRWHHSVDYKPFKKNKLIKKENIKIKNCVNNYGMKIKEYNQKMHITTLYDKFN